MNTKSDKLISSLTVRLKDSATNQYIGTGVIYYAENLKDKVYIITASHCLFKDGDKFQNQRGEVIIDVLSKNADTYLSIKTVVNSNLLIKNEEKDVAILMIDRLQLETIIGKIPKVNVVKEKSALTNFVTKGFPQATQSKEIAVLYPEWLQAIDSRFQLELKEDYGTYNSQGFSGSGIFLTSKSEFFLFGIFTRIRGEGKGKVIYCQFVDTVNEILGANYLPLIGFNYFGAHGLTTDFIKSHIESAITGLGPRFSEELNFQLPIAKSFNELARDSSFKGRFFKGFDDWILQNEYKKLKDNIHLNEIEAKFVKIKSRCLEWLKSLDFSIDKKIDIEWLINALEDLNKETEQKADELYALSDSLRAEEQNKANNPFPFNSEITRLRDISWQNRQFISILSDKINLDLVNHPYLIIKGEAGYGKSHLLGDIAKKRIENNLPTLLFLGQNLDSHKNIWENLHSELNLNCSNKELLEELNSIGKQIGSRVLILIDAINEGGGADLWNSRIASFINDFTTYPYVGLVLTIRTTYIDLVIPSNVTNNPNVSILTHQGFKGNEYAALKLFCEFYDLKQPHFPLLTPEFSNPLFLKIICEAIKDTEEKTFPQGFQGISSIFQLYLNSLNLKFDRKREEYRNRKIVEKAIHLLAHECFNKEDRIMLLEDAFSLFDNKFPNFKYLINDLIEESVFIRRIDHNFETNQNQEVIYFSYERFGDFFIAEDIINGIKNIEEILELFAKDGNIGKLIDDRYWQYGGLFEAFSVLIPEKFELEIYEAFEWIHEDQSIKKYQKNEIVNRITQYFFESLNWRKIESINFDKILGWIKSKKCRIDNDELFLKLYELAPIKDHPFNSDRLFLILNKDTLCERDGFLQQHMRDFNGFNDEEVAYPMRRLIEWAWTPEISQKIDSETARLTAQALIWLLSSTHRKLRDETTKTLVNLLEQQPDALIALLKKFDGINDFYIAERLYAVAYGCVLRIRDNKAVIKIAKVVYNNVFKNGNPPSHILLRDYARNAIEYALYINPNLKIDMDLVRPPYKSLLPDSYPTSEEIEKYKLDDNSKEYKIDNGQMANRIYYSVLASDFSRYTIDSTIGRFYPAPFTFENEYKKFIASLKTPQRRIMKLFEDLAKKRGFIIEHRHFYRSDKKEYEGKLNIIETLKTELLNDVQVFFDETQTTFVKEKVLKYLELKHTEHNSYGEHPDSSLVKNWIINRVFELGYDYRKHGWYDNVCERQNNRHENTIERIGKKYQWIAFYDILARLSDNYKISSYTSEKSSYFKGPWQLLKRDIDPAFTRKLDEKSDENEISQNQENINWHDDPQYNHWNQDDNAWVENITDFPSLQECLLKKDENSDEWISLRKFVSWKKPKPIGEDEYRHRQKRIFYKIQGYLVEKKNKAKIVRWMNNQNFWGDWMPEDSSKLQLMNRESFWSPAYLDMCEENDWKTIQNTRHKIIIATANAVGEMSEDKSGAHFYHDMPCKTLFEGMKLEYAPLDGNFVDANGNLVVQYLNHKQLFRKKNLLDFLAKNDLELVWIVIGEKMAYTSFHSDATNFKQVSGAFYLEDDKIKGSTRVVIRN